MPTDSDTGFVEDCPCCNNPWRRTGDIVASSSGSSGATGLPGGFMFCGTCSEPSEAPAPVAGLSRSNIDWKQNSSENFFLWANGNWMKTNPIPPEYPSWNTFTALHVQSQERCRELLDELLATLNKSDDDEEESKSDKNKEEAIKVACFFQAAMDEETIESQGIAPLKKVLELVELIVQAFESGDKSLYASRLGQLAADHGIYVFFKTGASPDGKDSNHTLAQVAQGGLGLPDKDYYFDEDKQDKRDAYKVHVAKMLSLLLPEKSTDGCQAAAQRIFDLETELANSHMSKTENRDPLATYNKMSLAALAEKGESAFDFEAYFAGSTKTKPGESVVEKLGDVNVRNVKALEGMAKVASQVEAGTLRDYLQWHVAKMCAPYLTKAFVQENFEFFEKTLSGTQEIKPRWKRAMVFTEAALGEALGKLYCDRYFDEDSKKRALAIVESVRAALEERLKEVEWIKSDSTRTEALEKMSRFRVKIGYPNEWIDYSTLVMDPSDTLVEMVFKARAFEHAREVKEMNAPTDREKWFMTPQTVNAYYHPNLNEVVFPAAILQHPFFDKEADDAVNYGSMGAVVGHEMTHGFDDKGRKYNKVGELHDWWTEEDGKEYEARVDVMVKQASEFEVHGQKVKGQLTSGENIADLGGLRLALRALKATEGFDSVSKTDGFTPEQRFFLAWAQCWRQNITKERSLQLISLDPHGPNEMRCNGPLSNMPEFHHAFRVPEGSPMYKPAEKRVNIW